MIMVHTMRMGVKITKHPVWQLIGLSAPRNCPEREKAPQAVNYIGLARNNYLDYP